MADQPVPATTSPPATTPAPTTTPPPASAGNPLREPQHHPAPTTPRSENFLTRIADWLTPQRLRHYPLALLVGTILIYAVSLARSTNWIEPAGSVIGRDFLAFFMAGDLVNHHQTTRLYNFADQENYQQQFVGPANPNWVGIHPFLNPPHYAALMAPLARVGYGPALLLWTTLALAACAAAASIWRTWLQPGEITLVILLTICSPPAFQALAGGQNTFFSLLIITGFCAALLAGRDTLAGLILALLAYKFQLTLLPLAVLLCKRRWRAIAGLTVGGILTLAFTAATLGTGVIFDYIHFAPRLGELLGLAGFDIHKQHSWTGACQLLVGDWLPAAGPRLFAAVPVLAALIMLARIWRGPWERTSPRFSLQLCALIIATLLTSPYLFHYDMLLIVPALILWWRVARTPAYRPNTPAIQTIIAAGFIWLALSSALAPLTHIQLSPLLMTILLLLLMRMSQPANTCAVQPAIARAPAAG